MSSQRIDQICNAKVECLRDGKALSRLLEAQQMHGMQQSQAGNVW